MATIVTEVDVDLNEFTTTEILNELNSRLQLGFTFLNTEMELLRKIIKTHSTKIKVGMDFEIKLDTLNNQIKLEYFLTKLDVINLNELETFLASQK